MNGSRNPQRHGERSSLDALNRTIEGLERVDVIYRRIDDLFLDPEARDLHENLGTVDAPLNSLGSRELTPGAAALAAINASLR